MAEILGNFRHLQLEVDLIKKYEAETRLRAKKITCAAERHITPIYPKGHRCDCSGYSTILFYNTLKKYK